MIELLPKDRAVLSRENEQVLSKLYELFDRDNDGVDPVTIAFALKGRVAQVPARLASAELQPYVSTLPDGRLVPTLRAAIRLWKTEDLKFAWFLYESCYQAYSPSVRQLTLQGTPLDKLMWKRLALLLVREGFAVLQGEPLVARINESILDGKNLAEYLAVRSGALLTSPQHQAVTPVTVSALSITGFRSFADASVNDLGPLTVFAGPNEAGKSNLFRAMKLAATTASRGVVLALSEQGGMRAVRRLASGAPVPTVRLGLRSSPAALLYELTFDPESVDSLPRPKETLVEFWDPAVKLQLPSDMSALKQTPLVQQRTTDGNVAYVWDEGAKSVETRHLQMGVSALAGVEDVQRFKRATEVKRALGEWAFYHFESSALRSTRPINGRLREDGSNLPGAILTLGQEDPKALHEVASAFTDLLPETQSLVSEANFAGQPTLQLREKGLTDPLTHVDFSDGMLRILALLCIAHSRWPPPVVCIEEPETGLYPRLIEAMVETLRILSKRSQVFLTTHSVTLLNRLKPSEVVFVYRSETGSQLQRLDSRRDVKNFATQLGIGTQLLIGNLEDTA